MERIFGFGNTKKEFQECLIDFADSILDARSPKCGEHTHFVSLFTEIIAKDIMEHCPGYGLTKKQVTKIVSASIMHDIGKVAVPDSVLLKPDRLSDEEYACMKEHTTIGAQLFETVSKLWDKEYADLCRDIILYHHERYDGKGYPRGLVGDEIPIAAQIVALADVYDALVAHRVYKENIQPDEAVSMIVRGDCGAFSDTMLKSLKRTQERLKNVAKL